MAHTKQLGSTKLGRDSRAKRLGVKRQHSQVVKAGEILIRQRGTQYLAGDNVRQGADDTLYAAIPGAVHFKQVKKTLFNGKARYATQVNVSAVRLAQKEEAVQ